MKRKLPGFIRQREVKIAKKKVRFDGPDCGTLDSLDAVTAVDTVDDGQEVVKVSGIAEPGEKSDVATWDKMEEESTVGEIQMLEKMYGVFGNLNCEYEERKLEARLKDEVSGGPTPPSSQDSINSNASWAFELAYSSATDEVEPSDIFDFIFKYITDHQKDIYGRIGTGQISRAQAEDYLRNAPRDLLQILESALLEAERKVNHFSA